MPEPPGFSLQRLNGWRDELRIPVAIRRFQGERSQLHRMIMPLGRVTEVRAARVQWVRTGNDTRLQIEGDMLTWSQIGEEWERTGGRLVVLGDPGYGKTVAVLNLAKRIAADSDPRGPVAELFPLADWYRWYIDHQGEPLDAWLGNQLHLTYDFPAVVTQPWWPPIWCCHCSTASMRFRRRTG